MAVVRVLVVEDDPSVQERYQMLFEQTHKKEFSWVLAPNGQRAMLALENHPSLPIDIVVLDWLLPDMEGLQILKRIKADPATRDILVLMVTAMQSAQNATQGLETGADDYLRKGFANEEFIARLHSLLRRREQAIEEGGGYILDGLILNPNARTVVLKGCRVELRPKEFDLLRIFLTRPNIVHGQTYLAEAISPQTEQASPEAVRQHIHGLRKALEPWSERIEAHWGRGYALNTRLPVSRG